MKLPVSQDRVPPSLSICPEPDMINPEEYLELVEILARRYQKYGLPYEDLFQEGYLGLAEAAGRYDPNKGASFKTYAGFWIKKYMLRALDLEIQDNRQTVSLDEDTSPEPAVEDKAPARERLDIPEGMLKPVEEQILRLFYEDGLDLRQIAQTLNLTRERVRQYKNTALRRLRKG